jgi:hypothetical protein
MRRDIPATGSPILDSMIKFASEVARQVQGLMTPEPPPAPAEMTDEQLHSAIYNIGAELLNSIGPVIQASFARYGRDLNERRFKRPITTTVRGHVLNMSTDANDAYGLAIIGLNKHATAAALGPIRFILESLAWLSWLLEDADDTVRRGRAYRLAMNGISQVKAVGDTMNRVAPQSDQAIEIKARLTASTIRMKDELLAIAEEDGVTIPGKPGSMSKLAEQYVSDHGGYLTYAMLNSAGAHPGPGHTFLFYGNPETGISDFDFKHMFDRRAYWTVVAIQLYLGVCDLAAPVLGWPDWEATSAAIQQRLQPLADEARKRYEQPWRRALGGMPD